MYRKSSKRTRIKTRKGAGLVRAPGGVLATGAAPAAGHATDLLIGSTY